MQKGFIGYLNSNRYKIQSKTAGKRQQKKKMSGRSKQTKLNKQKPACGLVVVVCACIAVPRIGPIGLTFSLALSLSKDAWLEPSTKRYMSHHQTSGAAGSHRSELCTPTFDCNLSCKLEPCPCIRFAETNKTALTPRHPIKKALLDSYNLPTAIKFHFSTKTAYYMQLSPYILHLSSPPQCGGKLHVPYTGRGCECLWGHVHLHLVDW